MKPCTTCGNPVSRGGTAKTTATRCVICITNDLLRDFKYPASQSMQALLRERKEREHDRQNQTDA